ncbi:P-loop containing nucleoside triphosphate hydrolase protein [Lipomyces orientalis]|uniref:P-loop containing nucleoside triphosphate hydrolase protein n=1 Tax=Lipomyces orientalis TaxID=1233043 RepID=A0ACC3TG08_9ASCO
MEGNIRVFCRVRPQDRIDVSDMAFIKYSDRREIELTYPRNESDSGTARGSDTANKYMFAFDKVFDPRTKNKEIFNEVSPLVQSALDGYNVCIFSYGQTGSGKTYTMQVMASKDGIIWRAVSRIFMTSTEMQETGWTYIVQGQFLEIYDETVYDLLASTDELGKKKLDLSDDAKEKKIKVPGLTVMPLNSLESAKEVFGSAFANRKEAVRKCNTHSSRSHGIFIITLHGANGRTQERRDGVLHLVDNKFVFTRMEGFVPVVLEPLHLPSITKHKKRRHKKSNARQDFPRTAMY